ncbi:rhomboid family protein [Flavilitoribacter nigricans]|uniref:Rhomboid family intramembrane serine protease n=1 Tax=Flavilitoribacter nigricans (strain ATCC 23147 / DSM 23189 / NBRC 102662 / NCIMB 1420 / SS-2) TaxID=1122177 RepID=A0A2D0NFM1_FLAN2|nr:rhomboid family intramembrane serine protease [Flavilitoribacter nigricans]PHN07302.1 rhomboid family intramembrane serine protease [Flavilitoribacter nigricans DSM 23189 = NBRC 102662]
MHNASLFGTIILMLAGLVTYKGLRDAYFLDRYAFKIDPILIDREYLRLLSSGFLHAGWLHFGFNMIVLLSFSSSLEVLYGFGPFTLLYFASLIGGNLLALYIHRNHGDYSAVGASGAISGVVLSYLVLFPDSDIGFILIPISIKSWIFALLFVVISIFGIKSQSDNIGHEAHLGGGIVGVLLTPFLAPEGMTIHWWVMAMILVPTTLFLLLIIRNPAVMMVREYWGENVRDFQSSLNKTETPASRQAELDDLLDKIRLQGYESLSQKERKRLENLKDEM